MFPEIQTSAVTFIFSLKIYENFTKIAKTLQKYEKLD